MRETILDRMSSVRRCHLSGELKEVREGSYLEEESDRQRGQPVERP